MITWKNGLNILKTCVSQLPSVPGRKQMFESQVPLQILAGRWRMALPDCVSELWPQPQTMSHLFKKKDAANSLSYLTRELSLVHWQAVFRPWKTWGMICRLTGFSPDRQVFILLNVQHELQSIPHASLGGDKRGTSITSSIKGVAFPIPSKHLRWQMILISHLLQNTSIGTICQILINSAYPLGVSVHLSISESVKNKRNRKKREGRRK